MATPLTAAMVNVLGGYVLAPGKYKAVEDLPYDAAIGKALYVPDGVDGVEIDLDGHMLYNTVGANTSAIGIQGYQAKNVKIHNGLIKGFAHGIDMREPIVNGAAEYGLNSGGHVIQNLRVTAFKRGIYVMGRGIQIERVSTYMNGRAASIDRSIAIDILGPSCVVKNVAILETYPTQPASEVVGLSISDQSIGAVVEDVVISNPFIHDSSFGFWGFNGDNVANEIKNVTINGYYVGYINLYSGRIIGPRPRNCGNPYAVGPGVTIIET